MAEDHQREFGDMGDLFTNENPDAPIKVGIRSERFFVIFCVDRVYVILRRLCVNTSFYRLKIRHQRI